jgi:hypothetical protein
MYKYLSGNKVYHNPRSRAAMQGSVSFIVLIYNNFPATLLCLIIKYVPPQHRIIFSSPGDFSTESRKLSILQEYQHILTTVKSAPWTFIYCLVQVT